MLKCEVVDTKRTVDETAHSFDLFSHAKKQYGAFKALLIYGILSRLRYYPSRDEDDAIIRPLPRIKHLLSDSSNLPHLVQLLLTFDPVLVEKVAILLYLILEDNARLPTLYLTGFFFFVLMYIGSNLLPIGRFLEMAHVKQVGLSFEPISR